MSLRLGLSAILLLAAAPAFGQPPAAGSAATQPAQPAQPPQPSPAEMNAIQTAAQGFGTCITTGVQSVPATVTPEAGATSVLAGCATQKQALVQAVEAMIANMPAEAQTAAHSQMESQLAQVPTQIADGIRQGRAAAAAPASPATPAAPATPPPH